MASIFTSKASVSQILPFAVFMSFIAVDEAARFLASHGAVTFAPTTLYFLYPLKAGVVALLLLKYRSFYTELRWKDLAELRTTAAVLLVGFSTCLLWILMDWNFAPTGPPQGFNPVLFSGNASRLAMTAIRVAGAVLVVPLMEELFWRSFLLRYLVHPDFESVPLGTFTWFSFIATVILFGFEHHFLAAGMVAGAIYNVVLYQTRSLAHCVFAHAVTNLALASYVLYTGKWYFW
jgi:uncharacterized protein